MLKLSDMVKKCVTSGSKWSKWSELKKWTEWSKWKKLSKWSKLSKNLGFGFGFGYRILSKHFGIEINKFLKYLRHKNFSF